ncbi:MAG: OsmC family protein [Leeuwenhoekiella sp.]
MTSKVTYQGNLRTHCEHLKSGNTFITDAPTDNNGKGEAFSPTDTVATALASCMITIMGIKAEQHGLDIENTYAEVTKTMSAKPRRISGIKVEVYGLQNVDGKNREILENAALTCPVFHSLHPDIDKDISFYWNL